MTSGPTDPIYDPVLEKMLTKPSHDKARAYGYSLANSVIEAFQAGDFKQSSKPSIVVRSTEIELGIENFMLSLGTLLGVIDTDPKFSLTPPFMRYLSEVAFIQLEMHLLPEFLESYIQKLLLEALKILKVLIT